MIWPFCRVATSRQLLETISQRLARVETLLLSLTKLERKEMAAIDDLNAAVADLKTEVAEIGTDMDAQFAALQAAQAVNDPAAIASATTAIRASIDALKAAAARDMPTATP